MSKFFENGPIRNFGIIKKRGDNENVFIMKIRK